MTAEVRARYARAAPHARIDLYPGATHELDNSAQSARLGWLRDRLLPG